MPARNKPSILIINRTFPPSFGATGRMACDLALHLRKKGHHVTILTTAKNHKIDRAKNMDVIRIEANQNPEGIFQYLKILYALYKQGTKIKNHDIVISMTDPPLQAIAGDKIAKRMNAKHIHWAMDLYPDLLPVLGKNINKFIFNIIQKTIYKTYKNTDAMVSLSPCMTRYLTHHSVPKNNIHTIENWPNIYLKEEGETKPLFDESKFRILYAGTIGLAHEFETILKAARHLQKHAPDIEFIFTKKGSGADQFVQQVKKLRLTNIRFIPLQSPKNLSALMASGDLHLITMKPDACGKLFPSKFYSALAANRPSLFIGPKECSLHDIIKNNKIGAYAVNGDAKSITRSILDYYKNGDQWFEHCENAKQIMNKHNPLEQWVRLIDSL